MRTTIVLRGMSFAAVVLAGSCAAPTNQMGDPTVFADGAVNHPITVAPAYRSLKVAFADSADGLSAEDRAQLASFVSGYLAAGNGAISVAPPHGAGSSEAIQYIGEQLVAMGVPRSRILVGTRDVTGNDDRIELGYVSYVAHTDPCGNWSQDADDTGDNLPMPDFGCAVQHNIAAMVADPRDLVTPRALGAGSAARRTTLTKQYETGQTTSAQKTQEQSGAVSQVAGGSQ
jgi:pilus assembly protein CpaD